MSWSRSSSSTEAEPAKSWSSPPHRRAKKRINAERVGQRGQPTSSLSLSRQKQFRRTHTDKLLKNECLNTAASFHHAGFSNDKLHPTYHSNSSLSGDALLHTETKQACGQTGSLYSTFKPNLKLCEGESAASSFLRSYSSFATLIKNTLCVCFCSKMTSESFRRSRKKERRS